MRLFQILLPLVCSFGLLTSLSAQISSGTIDYLEARTFPMWEGMSNEMKERVEEARANGDFDRIGRMSFDQEAFSYSQVPRERNPNQSSGRGRGGGWMMRAANNTDVYYTSMLDSSVIENRRILDRTFIIEDNWQIPEWEVPENQRPNMAYTLPSEVAYAVSADGDTLTAYFTRSIPLAVGPRGYGGLPGAIVYLKVEKDGSFVEYTMQTMQPNPPELNLSVPEEGESISREDYNELKARREASGQRRTRRWHRG